MEIEFKIKVDTDKEEDIELVEDLLHQLQDLYDILQVKKQTTHYKKRSNKN